MTRLWFSALLFVLVIFLTDREFGQERTRNPSRIDIQRSGSELLIVGTFVNDTEADVEFSYRLDGRKNGPSGTSSTRQSGSFQAESHMEVSLSKIKFNFDSRDVYELTLLIMDGETIVACDSVVYPGAPKKER